MRQTRTISGTCLLERSTQTVVRRVTGRERFDRYARLTLWVDERARTDLATNPHKPSAA